jgi:hypothetical protein
MGSFTISSFIEAIRGFCFPQACVQGVERVAPDYPEAVGE